MRFPVVPAAAPRLAAALLVASALGAPPAAAQEGIHGGLFAVHAPDVFGGATGGGVLLAVDLPLLPMRVRAFGERYLPDCGSDAAGREMAGCAFGGGGVDVLFDLPVPLLAPYLVGGLAYRFLDAGDAWEGGAGVGAVAGGGVRLRLPVGPSGATLFGEGRRELLELDAPGPVAAGRAWTLRAGVVLPLL